MAKKKRVVRKKKATKVGGRKKRAWSVVTFDELEAWRAVRNIPKKKMAEMLEVTNSTYHNWARGIAVATPNTQERIRRMIESDGVPVSPGTPAKSSSSVGVMETTGKIVASYLETKPSGMTAEKLVKLVRDVKHALV